MSTNKKLSKASKSTYQEELKLRLDLEDHLETTLKELKRSYAEVARLKLGRDKRQSELKTYVMELFEAKQRIKDLETIDQAALQISEITLLKEHRDHLEKSLKRTDEYLNGLSTGSEIGTDMKTAGERTKRYAHQIQVEIRTALNGYKRMIK